MCGNGNLENFVLILVKNKDLSLSNDQNVVLFMLHFLENKLILIIWHFLFGWVRFLANILVFRLWMVWLLTDPALIYRRFIPPYFLQRKQFA